ncbi:MAG: hypothetical protein ACE5H7_03850 [Acidiferrobacterales bacterium]
MLASLPMYDLPAIRRATDAWWRGLAAAFRRAGIENVLDALTRGDETGVAWYDPGPLFSQTCGYPLVHKLSGVLQPLATPVYDAPGCVWPRYRSAIVNRSGNPAASLMALRGGICAVNRRDSQSGYHSFRTMLAPLANGKRLLPSS